MNHSLAPSIVSTNAICSIMNTYSFSNENPWTVSNRIVRKLILSEIHGPRQHGQNRIFVQLMAGNLEIDSRICKIGKKFQPDNLKMLAKLPIKIEK